VTHALRIIEDVS